MAETILVTGIHREELGFGDRVAALLDNDRIHIMRIPRGISHARAGTGGDLFYYNTRHREIYLQLRQQMKGRYRLLIDLHCGLNEAGRCADIYCRDERLLQCVSERAAQAGMDARIRMVKILADSESSQAAGSRDVEAGARTAIPKQIWNDQGFTYVGLEIYLAEEGVGVDEDWRFARDLIETIRVCGMIEKRPETA